MAGTAERAWVNQTLQLGLETLGSEGVAVACNRQLGSMQFDIGENFGADPFVPGGNKAATDATPGQEMTDISVVIKPTYDEMAYWYTLMYGDGTPSSPG